MFKFPDINGFGAPFTSIHPYKQKQIKHLIDNITPDIDYVIIFGSAVQHSCWIGSDIDVCLVGVGEYYPTRHLRQVGQAYDFLFYPDIDTLRKLAENEYLSIEKEIWEKGVLVYDKSCKLVKTS